jgi:membrane associated rhomboid family serine protease
VADGRRRIELGGGIRTAARRSDTAGGLQLLVAIVAVMWLVEVVNALDSQHLSRDGILARNVAHLWGIVTSPFLHAGWAHLIANTVPLLFLGAIVALRGAARLAAVTAIVILLGGLGTWLIAPAGSDTIGASGVVFGYATYLLARGFFNRSALEVLVGVIVGVVWGGALVASLVPHAGVSWQAHVCGGIAGVIAAWVLARPRGAGPGGRPRGSGGSGPGLPTLTRSR